MQSLIKKIAAVIIAVATMLGFAGLGATTALAADTGSVTINTNDKFVTDGNGDPEPIKYYQMFSAEVDATSQKVTYTLNDSWKPFFTSSEEGAAGTRFVDGDNGTVSEKAVEYIKGLTDAQRADFANLAKKWAVAKSITATGTVTPDKDATSVTISNLGYGYYLIVPDDDQKGSNGKYQSLLVGITDSNTTSIFLKNELPTVDKTVSKDNGNNSESTDVNVGDEVTYTLSSKVPNMEEYKNGYTFNFVDTLSEGLDFVENSVAVKIYNDDADTTGTTLTAGTDYELKTGTDAAPYSIRVNMTNFRDLHQKDAGKKIVVTYNAKLNQKAITGTDGNTNKAQVEYSNDPNSTGFGTSIPDEVKVHTFDFTIDKFTGDIYNESSLRLAGAKFKVYKEADTTNLDKSTFDETTDTLLKFTTTPGSGSTALKAVYAPDQNATGLTEELTTPDYGRINVAGLEAGVYWVQETAAPDGYNKITGAIRIDISAKYDTDDGTATGATTKGGNGKLVSWETKYTPYDADGKAGTPITDKGNSPVVPVKNENSKDKPILPSTGGMGTILFTVFGVLIVALGTAWYVKSNRKTTK